MSTIAGEIARISGNVSNSLIEVGNKGVVVPAGANSDDLAGLIRQIQQGGSENAFLTETDLSYMFDYRKSSDDKIIAGIQRMSQNTITDLSHCFDNFNDDRVSGTPADAGVVIGYIQNILRNNPTVPTTYFMYYFTFPSNNNYVNTIDLSGIKFTKSCNYMFAYTGRNQGNGSLTFIIDKDTFSEASTVQTLFGNAYENIIIKNKDSKICFKSSPSSAFQSAGLTFQDVNGNVLRDITIDITSLVSVQSMFASFRGPLDSVTFEHGENISNYSSTFQNFYNLKSVKGVNFEGVGGNTYGNMFNTSGTTYFDSFGELGIVNGSKFRPGGAMNLNLTRIWHGVTTDIRDGQTIGYWYEKFANALGTKTSTNTHTITINTTLYNSLTQAQKELITDKGYVLASAS